MTPWCDDLVCSWRRLLADRHSLPFPWTLSLHRRWCPSASHHPLTFLFLLALTFPLPSPFPSLGLGGGGGGLTPPPPTVYGHSNTFPLPGVQQRHALLRGRMLLRPGPSRACMTQRPAPPHNNRPIPMPLPFSAIKPAVRKTMGRWGHCGCSMGLGFGGGGGPNCTALPHMSHMEVDDEGLDAVLPTLRAPTHSRALRSVSVHPLATPASRTVRRMWGGGGGGNSCIATTTPPRVEMSSRTGSTPRSIPPRMWCRGRPGTATLNVGGGGRTGVGGGGVWRGLARRPGERPGDGAKASPNPPCDIPSGCCSFTGPRTLTHSSLRMLRRVAAFCRPLRPVLLLVSFPCSQSPVAPKATRTLTQTPVDGRRIHSVASPPCPTPFSLCSIQPPSDLHVSIHRPPPPGHAEQTRAHGHVQKVHEESARGKGQREEKRSSVTCHWAPSAVAHESNTAPTIPGPMT